MKQIYNIFILFLLIPIPLTEAHCVDEIKEKALELKGTNDIDTINNIDGFVEAFTNHTFYWNPRNQCQYWRDHIGDCTDKALLKVTMLESLGIETRLVHGYSINFYPEIYFVLHDWFEFKYMGTWYTFEYQRFPLLKKVGRGVW